MTSFPKVKVSPVAVVNLIISSVLTFSVISNGFTRHDMVEMIVGQLAQANENLTGNVLKTI